MTEKLKEIWQSKKAKDIMLIIVIIGGLLAVLALPVQKEGKSENESGQEVPSEVQSHKQEDYEAKLEERLEQILRKVEGVGDVEVMITLEASSKEVVEKDVTLQQTLTQNDEQNITDSVRDKEETTVYTDLGSGNAPYVVQEIYPEVQGVLVVAEGGDDSRVNLAIVEAIQSLFDIDVHKIKIVKMNT